MTTVSSPLSRSPTAPASLGREQLLELVLLHAADALARGAARQPVPPGQGHRRAVPLARAGGRRVGSAYALDRAARRHPLAADPQPRLAAGDGRQPRRRPAPVHGQGQPVPTRGRELNIHFGDLERGFIGQISHLGDMVPVMAGITLHVQDARRAAGRPGLRRRRRDVHRRVPRRDQLRRRAAAPAGRRGENNGYAYSHAARAADGRCRSSWTRPRPTACPAMRADGNDVLAVYEVTTARGGPRPRRARGAR